MSHGQFIVLLEHRYLTRTQTTTKAFSRPVPTRKRHNDKPRSDKNLLDINPQHVVNLLTQNSTDPPIIDLLTPRNPDVAPLLLDLSTTPPKSRRSAEAKIATFSELLNDRIQEAMLDVDRRALHMEARYNKYATTLRSTERKQQALWEKDEQGLALRESLAHQRETKLTHRARDLAEIERQAVAAATQREEDMTRLMRRTSDVFDEHKRQVDTLTLQSELAVRAWHEVEMTKVKDMLAANTAEHTERINEFCTVQLQNLESNLDS